MVHQRPLGITVLAVLPLFSGVVLLALGLTVLIFPAVFNSIGEPTIGLGGETIAVIGSRSLAFVISSSIWGMVSLAIAYGLLDLKWWAWLLSLIFFALGISQSLLRLLFERNVSGSIYTIIDIAIRSFSFYYLCRPKIREAFGRRDSPSQSMNLAPLEVNHLESEPNTLRHPMMSAGQSLTRWIRKGSLFLAATSWLSMLILRMNTDIPATWDGPSPVSLGALIWASVPFLLLLGLHQLPLWFGEAVIAFIGTLILGGQSVWSLVLAGPDTFKDGGIDVTPIHPVASLIYVLPLLQIIFVLLISVIIILARLCALMAAALLGHRIDRWGLMDRKGWPYF